MEKEILLERKTWIWSKRGTRCADISYGSKYEQKSNLAKCVSFRRSGRNGTPNWVEIWEEFCVKSGEMCVWGGRMWVRGERWETTGEGGGGPPPPHTPIYYYYVPSLLLFYFARQLSSLPSTSLNLNFNFSQRTWRRTTAPTHPYLLPPTMYLLLFWLCPSTWT